MAEKFNKWKKDASNMSISIRPKRSKEWTTYEGIFNDIRLDKDTLPEGYYAYDIRGNDYGEPFGALEKSVVVNFEGTFVTKQKVDFNLYLEGSDCIKLQNKRVQYIFEV